MSYSDLEFGVESDFVTEKYEKDLLAGREFIQTVPSGVTIFGSARTVEGNSDYEQARALGSALAKNGETVITGGGGGIMEAANRGALEAIQERITKSEVESVGMNIVLPKEQHLNEFTTKSHTFHYFFSRKTCMLNAAKAYVYFPGGFGTLDELTEAAVLVQTKKIPPLPLILFDTHYWGPLISLIDETLLVNQMISAGDQNIFQRADTIEEVLKLIK
ncbi:MAG: TIGR00730 family Rossman fold protein [Candidatus Ancillula sp.]|jgi:uncharacterized protein (TIGR00730 family)|nr:TIGR00730 family Rossman fold protein [Candidatus Ancillula sp.]